MQFGKHLVKISLVQVRTHYSQSGQKQPNLGTLVIRFLHVESSKLHDSKCYSIQFFMYFKPMITIFPNFLKFDYVKIWHHVDNHSCTEYQYYSSLQKVLMRTRVFELGGITVDDLTSASINDSNCDLNGFSKMPLEVFWNFMSISIRFCRAWHVWQTFK